MTKTYKIAAIPGDGIGKEVMPEGLRVLEAAARRFDIRLQFTHADWASRASPATSTSSSCARTPRASTPTSAA